MGISKTEILNLFKDAGLNVSSDAKDALETQMYKALKAKVSALSAAKARAGKKTVFAEDIPLLF